MVKENFRDLTPTWTAQVKLQELQQGSKTADEYVLEFRSIEARTGYNDLALIEKFERGLNRALLQKIYTLPEMPKTLKDYQDWVMKLDCQWRMFEKSTRCDVRPQGTGQPRTAGQGQRPMQGPHPFRREGYQPTRNDGRTAASAQSKDPNAMDVD